MPRTKRNRIQRAIHLFDNLSSPPAAGGLTPAGWFPLCNKFRVERQGDYLMLHSAYLHGEETPVGCIHVSRMYEDALERVVKAIRKAEFPAQNRVKGFTQPFGVGTEAETSYRYRVGHFAGYDDDRRYIQLGQIDIQAVQWGYIFNVRIEGSNIRPRYSATYNDLMTIHQGSVPDNFAFSSVYSDNNVSGDFSTTIRRAARLAIRRHLNYELWQMSLSRQEQENRQRIEQELKGRRNETLKTELDKMPA